MNIGVLQKILISVHENCIQNMSTQIRDSHLQIRKNRTEKRIQKHEISISNTSTKTRDIRIGIPQNIFKNVLKNMEFAFEILP